MLKMLPNLSLSLFWLDYLASRQNLFVGYFAPNIWFNACPFQPAAGLFEPKIIETRKEQELNGNERF
jgi:hypothetical protein